MWNGFLQDWTTIEGSGVDPIIQSKDAWLDLARYGDVALWLEVRAVANPGAGNVELSYETAPSTDPDLFRAMASLPLVATSTPVVTSLPLSSDPVIPLARWLRWRLTGTTSGAWRVCFRVHAMARKSTSGGVFDPASLAMSGWWRASYGGAPWAGSSSAGASGSRSLTTLGSDPSVGSSLNMLASADFDGTANQLTTGLAGSALVSASALSFWALIQADTVPADPGVGSRWQGAALFGDSGATYLQVALTTAGASLGLTASGAYDEVTAACSTGAPHLVQAKFDGTDLKMRVDSGAWQSVPATNGPGATIDDLSNTIKIGVQTQYFDGRLWDMAFASTVWSDSTFDSVKGYINARYSLSL